MGTEFRWRWGRGTISANLDVIWGMSDQSCCRASARLRSETDTIARLGGDEFAIIRRFADQSQDATALAQRICEALEAPFDLGDHQVVVGTSIGIAVAPADGVQSGQLLKKADLALYDAKDQGRGQYKFFEPEMGARIKARRVLETELRSALDNNEFELYYQPIVNLKENIVAGFEALLRWNHPERGVVSPADFISVS